MVHSELRTLAHAIIGAVEPDNCKIFIPNSRFVLKISVVEDSLEKLRFFFPENLVLAALDLIDRENGKFLLAI